MSFNDRLKNTPPLPKIDKEKYGWGDGTITITGVRSSVKEQAYNPSQPRHPPGSSKGGEFAGKGETATALNIGDMKKVGAKPGGSVPGAVYQDSEGSKWIVKYTKDEDRATNEVLAGKLYEAVGVKVPQLELVNGDKDQTWVGSKMMTDLKPLKKGEQPSGLNDGFAADAWLSNWDVVGLEYDNIATQGGNAVRMDVGGALEYRAQGAPKGAAFGNVPSEITSLRNPSVNRQSANVFKNVSDASIRKGVKRIASLGDYGIRKIVGTYKKGSQAKALADKLIARKNWLMENYPDQFTMKRDYAQSQHDYIQDVVKEFDVGGTYSCCFVNMESAKRLYQWARDRDIPNLVPPEEMHCTIAHCEKKGVGPDYKLLPISVTISDYKGLEHFGDALVLVLDPLAATDLEMQFDAAIASGAKLTTDFGGYKAHVTLSYDAYDFDLDEVPGFPITLDPEVIGQADEHLQRRVTFAQKDYFNPAQPRKPKGDPQGGQFAPKMEGDFIPKVSTKGDPRLPPRANDKAYHGKSWSEIRDLANAGDPEAILERTHRKVRAQIQAEQRKKIKAIQPEIKQGTGVTLGPKADFKPNVDTFELSQKDDVATHAEVKRLGAVLRSSTVQLSDSELASVRSYTGSGYAKMNDDLRKGGTPTAAALRIDSALAKQKLPEDITVYRRFGGSSTIGQRLKDGDATLIGSEVVDKGFISTTIRPPGKSIYTPYAVIKLPKGTSGMYVKPVSHVPGEEEFLMPRNSRFLVSGLKKIGNKNVVELEYLGVDE